MPAVRRKSTKAASSAVPLEARRRDLASVGLYTSEQVVKALKAGGDRTTTEGLDKLDVARIAWFDDEKTPIPRKAHLLAEWLLGVLFREARSVDAVLADGKGKAKQQAPAFTFAKDVQCWHLLHSVLQSLSRDELRLIVGRHSLVTLLHAIGNAVQAGLADLTATNACLILLGQASGMGGHSIETVASATETWLDVVVIRTTDDAVVPLNMLATSWSTLTTTAHIRKTRKVFLDTLLPSLCLAWRRVRALERPAPPSLLSCLCLLSYACVADVSVEEEQTLTDRLCQVEAGCAAMPTILQQRCLSLRQMGDLPALAKERERLGASMASQLLRALSSASTPLELAEVLGTVEANKLVTSQECLSSVVQCALTQLTQHPAASLQCVQLVQSIDEDALSTDALLQVVAFLAKPWDGAGLEVATALIKSLSGSCARTRRMNHFVELLFDGVASGGSGARDASSAAPLFHQDLWQADIHPALANLVSPEQSVALLSLINTKIEAAAGAPHLAASLRLAAMVLDAVALPDPVQSELEQHLRRLHDGILPHLKHTPTQAKGSTTAAGDVFVASLRLAGVILRRAQLQPAWTDLLAHIETTELDYLPTKSTDVPVELLIAVLTRTRRDVVQARPTSLARWLNAYVTSVHFGKDAQIVICLAYLAVLERVASAEVLQTLAGCVVLQERASVLEAASSDASNLELPRWRAALLDAAEEQIKEGHTDVFDMLIARLPRDYVGSRMASFMKRANKSAPPVAHVTQEKDESGDLSAAVQGFVQETTAASSLARSSQRASVAEYEACLLATLKEVRRRRGGDESAAIAYQAASLLLCNGPDGSLAVAQSGLRVLLTTLRGGGGDDDLESDDALLVCRILEALVHGKAILFRSFDIGIVLSLLTRIAAAPPTTNAARHRMRVPHNDATTLFASLVATLIGLVRMRTHAIAPLLPQLSALLAQLVSLFRQQPAQTAAGRSSGDAAGGGASSAVNLPLWLDVRHPLGLAEARQFTRLCATITSRTHATASAGKRKTSPSQARVTTSLARAFGSHALPVVLAYVRALTLADHAGGTLFATGETRNELARAMFALCDVTGTWHRSVLMDMMADEGERIVCRQLWRSYEAQRYRGE